MFDLFGRLLGHHDAVNVAAAVQVVARLERPYHLRRHHAGLTAEVADDLTQTRQPARIAEKIRPAA